MVGPVAWEWVAFVVALAMCGAVAVAYQVVGAGRWLRVRWQDRGGFGPDEETEQEQSGLCAGCWDDSEHCDGAYDTCDCTCGWDEDWFEGEDARPLLPPERSREELGFGGPPPESAEVRQWRDLEARRERLASAAELEHRAAYEAMGLDYPSGLMARIRELAP